MFAYLHVEYSICLLRISLGRDKVAPSIHHLTTPKALNDIQIVSRYI